MAKKAERLVVVDSYALMADLTGQATPIALETLENIRLGVVKGVIHHLIIYEIAYHWRRGRLPFHDENELAEFIRTYFITHDPSLEDVLDAAKLKVEGDRLLRDSGDKDLMHRRISASDALTLVLAKKLGAPIVSGDKDLVYVAAKIGVKIIW